MNPHKIITDIEIADVNFKVEIEFDRTPPVGEFDEEIFVHRLVILTSDQTLYLNSLLALYNTSHEFKSRINQLVLDVIHDRRPDVNAELVDSRW